MAEERLQKILARAGITSRRKAEELIKNGRVRVEGRVVTELGTKADTRAKIEVDGRRVEREQLCYGVLHKPRHMVTTLSDPEGRPTAHDILSRIGVRVVPVGRLDFNTSGALLFTNDGDFAQGLSHAKNGVPKVYVATVQGVPDERKLARWGESIEIDGKRTRPAEVRVLRREQDKSWIEVTIREGRNRQVRRLAEHARSSVVRLARISHAGIGTEGLRPGEWRLLTIDELKELKKSYGVPTKIRGVMEVAPEVHRPTRPSTHRVTRPSAAKDRPGERRGEGRATAGRAGPEERGGRPWRRDEGAEGAPREPGRAGRGGDARGRSSGPGARDFQAGSPRAERGERGRGPRGAERTERTERPQAPRAAAVRGGARGAKHGGAEARESARAPRTTGRTSGARANESTPRAAAPREQTRRDGRGATRGARANESTPRAAAPRERGAALSRSPRGSASARRPRR